MRWPPKARCSIRAFKPAAGAHCLVLRGKNRVASAATSTLIQLKKMNISFSLEINKPPQVVFTFVNNPANFPSWMSGIIANDYDPASVGHVGSTGTFCRRMLGRTACAQWTATKVQAPHFVEDEVSINGLHLVESITLKPTQFGSSLMYQLSLPLHGILSLFAGPLAILIKQQFKRDFQTLKQVLEQN